MNDTSPVQALHKLKAPATVGSVAGDKNNNRLKTARN